MKEKNNIKIYKQIKILNEVEDRNFEVNNSNNIICEKLKSLLMLYFQQKKLKQKTQKFLILNKNNISINRIQEGEAFLININWLKELGYYNNIIKIIKENIQIESKINANLSKEEETILSKILNIPNINIKYTEIEQILNKIHPKEPFSPEIETIHFSKQEFLKIYNEAIIVDKYLMQLFIAAFKIDKYIPTFKYTYGNKINMIIINDANQHIILLGDILNDHKLFKLKFIFSYENELYLKKELEEIKTKSDEKYICEKTFFNNNEEYKIYTSPIFEGIIILLVFVINIKKS